MVEYVCCRTKRSYPVDGRRWKSESGDLLDLAFDGVFDPAEVRTRPPSLWRYREALPIADDKHVVTFGEGMTPLQRIQVSGKQVLVKLDYLFPSGSYKDRGATVLMSHANAFGVRRVVQDSSGNAGASIATYAARSGISCEIFVPASTSATKLNQIAACGSRVTKVDGSREDAASAATVAAETTFYASHVWNPFFIHGTKTFAFEVCEQLDWRAPDAVVLPAGNGSLILGAYLGFAELQGAGITSHIPKIVGVQAANCSPLCAAFSEGLDHLPMVRPKETSAEGIAIANPPRGVQILQCVRNTGGTFLRVSESEIVATLRYLCQLGFFVEPTSAAVLAGVEKYLRCQASKNECVVSTMTGSGLKAAAKVVQALGANVTQGT